MQASLLQGLSTRVVVPLQRIERFANVRLPKNLNPQFEINGVVCFMQTPAMAAVPCKLLTSPVTSLIAQQAEITAALDFLFDGF